MDQCAAPNKIQNSISVYPQALAQYLSAHCTCLHVPVAVYLQAHRLCIHVHGLVTMYVHMGIYTCAEFLVMCYGPVWRVWLCAMGQCTESLTTAQNHKYFI
jgi:hypothetical protein